MSLFDWLPEEEVEYWHQAQQADRKAQQELMGRNYAEPSRYDATPALDPWRAAQESERRQPGMTPGAEYVPFAEMQPAEQPQSIWPTFGEDVAQALKLNPKQPVRPAIEPGTSGAVGPFYQEEPNPWLEGLKAIQKWQDPGEMPEPELPPYRIQMGDSPERVRTEHQARQAEAVRRDAELGITPEMRAANQAAAGAALQKAQQAIEVTTEPFIGADWRGETVSPQYSMPAMAESALRGGWQAAQDIARGGPEYAAEQSLERYGETPEPVPGAKALIENVTPVGLALNLVDPAHLRLAGRGALAAGKAVSKSAVGQAAKEAVPTVGRALRTGAEALQDVPIGLNVEDITKRSPEFLRANELAERLPQIDKRLEEIGEEMYPWAEELAALQEGAERIVRPPQNSPLAFWSNEALRELAEREGRNPYQDDWFDALDPVAVSDFQTSWQPTGGTTGKTAALRQEIGKLRDEERVLKREAETLGREYGELTKAIESDLPAAEYLRRKAAEREARANKGSLFEPGQAPEPPKMGTSGEALQPESWLPDVRPTGEILEMAYREDWPRKVADTNPAVGRVMGAIGVPGRDVVSQGRVLRETVKADWDSGTTGAMARLRQLGSSDRLFNVKDNVATLSDGTRVAINDLLEYPGRFALTPEQQRYATTVRKLYDDAKTALTVEGIPLRDLPFEEGGGYIARRVLGKVDSATGDLELAEVVAAAGGGGHSGRTVGKKAAFEKVRRFETQAEALAEGFRYLTPEETLAAHLGDVGKKIADKRLVDWALERLPYRTPAAPEELMLAKEHALKKYRAALRVEQAINRAQRGEELPSSLIRSIGEYYPVQARFLVKLGPKSPGLQALKEGLQPFKLEAKTAYLEADRAVGKALEKARTPRYGETSVGAPALGGKFFSTEDAKALQKMLDLEGRGKLRTVAETTAWLNALPRLFLTTFDLGGPLIQLQLMAGYRPVEWGKAVGRGLQALVDERGYQEFLAAHADTVNKWSPQGAMFTPSEFVSATEPGGVLSKVPVARRAVQPFARGFEGLLNAAKIYGLEATEHMAKTPEEMRDLATFWNQLTGTANTARMGLSPTQRAAETAVMFAPRYRRAVLGLMVDVSRGGLRGQMARESLAKATVAGLAAYTGLAYALGQEPQLDPRSGGKFLTVEIAGQRVGIGGAYMSTVRLLGRVALEPGKAPELATQYLRGMASPAVSSGIDVIKREDYAGRPLDTPLKLTKEVIAGNLTPLWAQSFLLEGAEGEGAAVRAAGEFGGLRTFPVSPAEKRDRAMEKAAQATFGKSADQLEPDEWDQLQRQNPEVAKLRREATEKYAEEGSSYHQYRLTLDELRDEKEAQIKALSDDLNAGRISGNRYRELVSERERDIAKLRDIILTSNPAFRQALDELEAKQSPEPKSQLEQYLDTYYQTATGAVDLRTGAVDIEELLDWREDLKRYYPAEIVQRAEVYLNRNRDPEYVKALAEFREMMAIPKYLGLSEQETRKADEISRYIRAMRERTGSGQMAEVEAIEKYGDDYLTYWLAKKMGTSPERKFFRMEHPLIQKYFSDVPLEDPNVDSEADRGQLLGAGR